MSKEHPVLFFEVKVNDEVIFNDSEHYDIDKKKYVWDNSTEEDFELAKKGKKKNSLKDKGPISKNPKLKK